eukprot:GHVO01041989.1.p1 GENE.GHVO01041989.1~~GHVO01041989.1.p1  ORF type:complete len:211 (-),score=47.53 GHVO01041989.1:5-637(-)
MSLSDLSRLWKLEGQARRQEREQLRSTDFENLGEWTPEQKELTKGDIRKLIRERKYQVWVDRMRAKGVPLTQCSTCQELAGRNHTCMAMKWKLQRAGGIKEKALFMTQDGKGDIKLGPKTPISPVRVDELRVDDKPIEIVNELSDELNDILRVEELGDDACTMRDINDNSGEGLMTCENEGDGVHENHGRDNIHDKRYSDDINDKEQKKM